MVEHRAWGQSRAEPTSQCRLHAAEMGSTLQPWGRFLQPGPGSSGWGQPRALQEAGTIPDLRPLDTSGTHSCVAVSSETASGRVSCPSRPPWCADLCEVRRKPPTFPTPALLGQTWELLSPGNARHLSSTAQSQPLPGPETQNPLGSQILQQQEPGEMRQVGETPEWGSQASPPARPGRIAAAGSNEGPPGLQHHSLANAQTANLSSASSIHTLSVT